MFSGDEMFSLTFHVIWRCTWMFSVLRNRVNMNIFLYWFTNNSAFLIAYNFRKVSKYYKCIKCTKSVKMTINTEIICLFELVIIIRLKAAVNNVFIVYNT